MIGSKVKNNEQQAKLNVLVLGGNGFIGSQIVQHLANKAQVTISTRNKQPKANEVTVRMHQMLDQAQWLKSIADFDIVINAVGILRERKQETYADVHTNSVAALANACQQLNVRLIHISAIGLSAKATSRFITSKYNGEQAILNSGADAVIVRPSLLDGEGGYGAKWFRRVALWPIQFVMQSKGLVSPLQVADLGEAVAKLSLKPKLLTANIVELGGEKVLSIPEYLSDLRASKGLSPAIQIAVNRYCVRLVSNVFDLFSWTPLSFGHYELMQGYNVPRENKLAVLLERKPDPTGWTTEVEGNCATVC